MHHLFDLTGRRALITGSSRGIGLALARGLASAGASIVLNGRSEETLGAAAEGLRGAGAGVALAPFDVTDPAAIGPAIDRIETISGPIDILVNNAGMTRRHRMDEFPDQEWAEVIDTNLNGVFHVSKAVARHMIPRGRGKIITTCSVMTKLARPGTAPYCATKGAVGNLTKAMCADWGPLGIQANGIAPGYFRTELTGALAADPEFSAWLTGRTPAGRWGELDDLIGAAIFLAAPASDYVNGHVLYVDGGMTAGV